MLPQWIIEKQRDGIALSRDEIEFLIGGYTSGTIPDYQMSAWAMAVTLRGLASEQTWWLTDAMRRSGHSLNTSTLKLPKIDKHSTGGIGDKVSLILAPLAAACGLAVPMISGRGLGITGGTLDKLEAIPGFNTKLSETEFIKIVATHGCAISGQTGELAPADKKLYALRDVTGTVSSIPLIASSIMSKKLAASLDGLVLDVKCGSGAFMQTFPEALQLAEAMVAIARLAGVRVAALVTSMEQPLGRTVGNALEVAESVAVLKGEESGELSELCRELAASMLCLGEVSGSLSSARALAEEKLASGQAFEKFLNMVHAQGGDTKVLKDPRRLPQAPLTREVIAKSSGYVGSCDAGSIGRVCVLLGAGRKKVEDNVDPRVGVSGIRKLGEKIEAGEPLARIHANDDAGFEQALEGLEAAFTIVSEKPVIAPLILKSLRAPYD